MCCFVHYNTIHACGSVFLQRRPLVHLFVIIIRSATNRVRMKIIMDAATPVPDGTATHEDDSAVETTDGVTDEQQPPSRKRHGARNQHKVKHFLRWLVKTFPTALERVRQSVIQEEEENTDNNNKEESQPRQQQNADKEEEGFSTAGAAATDADDDDGDDDDDSFFFTRPLVLDVAGGKGEEMSTTRTVQLSRNSSANNMCKGVSLN